MAGNLIGGTRVYPASGLIVAIGAVENDLLAAKALQKFVHGDTRIVTEKNDIDLLWGSGGIESLPTGKHVQFAVPQLDEVAHFDDGTAGIGQGVKWNECVCYLFHSQVILDIEIKGYRIFSGQRIE